MSSSIRRPIGRMLLAANMIVLHGSVAAPQAPPFDRDKAMGVVERIQKADYEGNRTALQSLFQELEPLAANQQLAAPIRYWRGFAMWRRALNGFNDSADRGDIEQDLRQAIHEFETAIELRPGLVDAQLGEVACLQNLGFIHQREPATVKELVNRFVPLLKASLAAAPENPRLLWVHGASQWYAPTGLSASEVATRQAAAIATYERGLRFARQQNKASSDALEPAWGEPELLMNLAWSNLNKAMPDVRAAEDYASQALALVPSWHYVRDILMAQIRQAKNKQ
jgi:tetratricopeptide (TPR) repeat protein